MLTDRDVSIVLVSARVSDVRGKIRSQFIVLYSI